MDVGEGVHFVHLGNSQAHESFVAATADVVFAAEFGAVAAASFDVAAHAVIVAAAAVTAAELFVVGVAAEFDVELCDVVVAGVAFALASVVAVTGVGVLSVLRS